VGAAQDFAERLETETPLAARATRRRANRFQSTLRVSRGRSRLRRNAEFEPTEQDHEIKARRQDERDEEQDRAREESRRQPSPDDDTKTSMTTRRITSSI